MNYRNLVLNTPWRSTSCGCAFFKSCMKRRWGATCSPRSSSANSWSTGLRGDGLSCVEGGGTTQGLNVWIILAILGLLALSGSGEMRLDLTAGRKPLQLFMVVLVGWMAGVLLYRTPSMRPKKFLALCFLVAAVLREPSCCELLLLGSSSRHQTNVPVAPRCAVHKPVVFV